MKVFELIKALQSADPEAEVVLNDLLYFNDDGDPVYAFQTVEKVIQGYADHMVTDPNGVPIGIHSDICFGIEPFYVSGHRAVETVYIRGTNDDIEDPPHSPNQESHPRLVGGLA